MISIIRDIILAIAAVITAIVAVLGLKSWKKELKGRTEFEVARNLIKSTYKVRDEIEKCRSPWITSNDFPDNYKETFENKSHSEEAELSAYRFTKRIKSVWETLQDFDISTLEAEVLWGDEIKNQAKEFRHCVVEIHNAMNMIIQNEREEGEIFKDDLKFGEKMRNIVSDILGSKNKDFENKVKSSIQSIENFIKPYLRKN